MSNDSPMPASLGRYRVLRRIGTGGMAEVFLAKNRGAEGIEKLLVVKRILPSFAKNSKFLTMFVDEAKVAMRLNHPNIVQVYAFEEVGGEFLLAMEFVDGLDLGRLLTASRRAGIRLPYELSAFVVMELARGLDYAHRRRDEAGEPMDIVHRDVSPQNVLISFDGVVKATDFGIAKARLVSEDEGVIKGKFGYMSPEQAKGARVDRRSDVYALGILLAELLMDRAMFPGLVGLDLLDRVRDGEIVLPRSVDPAVPAELERVVRRATARDPEERFQTARSLAGALTQYLHGQMELVDSEALERFITKIAPRDFTLPDGFPAPVFQSAALGMDSTEFVADRQTRERRRVVVVAGRLRGQMGDDGPIGRGAARVLEQIAYKVDAVLSWPDGVDRNHFRYVIGLGKASVNDPLRACSLALDTVEALQGLSADLLMPLGASIGISRGLVSTVREKDGRLLGYEPVDRAVEVAERLAASGGPDEILVAGEIYRMVRRDFAFDEDLDRQVPILEDGPETIRAFTLRGAFSREERAVALQGPESAFGFVGREPEIARIEALYGQAVAERRAVFGAVVGDLGMGKSALLRAGVGRLDPAPRVLRSECAFYTADVPYAIAADLVREACGISDDMSQDEARGRLVTTATELIGDAERRQSVIDGLDLLLHLGEHTGTVEDAEERGRRIMVGVERLIQALALRGPLVICADAMHWADSASLELLRHMLMRSYEVPCLILLGTRPDPRVERLFGGVERIHLGELDERERRALISARFEGAEVPPEVEETVTSRAGGNPFFVLELVDTLLERGVLGVAAADGRQRVVRHPGVPVALPTTLEGVISARIDDLAEGTRRSLRWLAVAGTGLRLDELSGIAGSSLVEDFAELELRGLVRRRLHGGYGFTSAVVRQVAYEGTDARDRTRMHKRIAEYLRARPGVAPGRVARHMERAGEPAAAGAAYLEAAEGARRVYSNREALRFYSHALRLFQNDPAQRFQAHSGRERILRFLGRRQDQATELAAMRRLAERRLDPGALALTLIRQARFELDGGRLVPVPELLVRALEAAEQVDDLALQVDALRLSAELAQYEGRFDEALDACARALARAGTGAELLSARGSVLVQRAILLRRTDRIDEALEAHAEAIVIFRRLGVKRHEAVALNSLGLTLADAGAYEDALEVIRASIALDCQTGDRLRLGRKLASLGKLHFTLGDADRGLEHTERALRALELVDDRSGSCDALCTVADIYLATRGPEAAFAALEAARRAASRNPSSHSAVRERLVRARAHRAAGRLGAAEAEARAALEAARVLSLSGMHLEASIHLAATLLEAGARDEASRVARGSMMRLRSGVTLERAEESRAELRRVLAALGHDDDAEAVREEGARLVERRAGQLRDPRRRAAYLATPPVGALTRIARPVG